MDVASGPESGARNVLAEQRSLRGRRGGPERRLRGGLSEHHGARRVVRTAARGPALGRLAVEPPPEHADPADQHRGRRQRSAHQRRRRLRSERRVVRRILDRPPAERLHHGARAPDALRRLQLHADERSRSWCRRPRRGRRSRRSRRRRRTTCGRSGTGTGCLDAARPRRGAAPVPLERLAVVVAVAADSRNAVRLRRHRGARTERRVGARVPHADARSRDSVHGSLERVVVGHRAGASGRRVAEGVRAERHLRGRRQRVALRREQLVHGPDVPDAHERVVRGDRRRRSVPALGGRRTVGDRAGRALRRAAGFGLLGQEAARGLPPGQHSRIDRRYVPDSSVPF